MTGIGIVKTGDDACQVLLGLGAADALTRPRTFSTMPGIDRHTVIDEVATSCYIKSDESGRDQGAQQSPQ